MKEARAPAVPGLALVDEWAVRINARWRSSVDAIIDVGRMLIASKAELPHGEFGTMIENKLSFGASTAQRLMSVAQDARLSNPAHAQHLPASWMTLYELTKLSDDEFSSAIDHGVIRPDMERREIAERIRQPQVAASSTSSVDDAAVEILPPDTEESTETRASIVDTVTGDDGGDIPAIPADHRAVMASRREPDDSLDFFPTPPWATRALIERVFHDGLQLPIPLSVWEPFCGEGHMSEVLREYGCEVFASDIFDYGGVHDALIDFFADPPAINPCAGWIISNSPFGEKAEQAVLLSLDRAQFGVAMFMPLRWLETNGRYERVFKDHPPTLIAIFAERVNLCKGRWEPEGATATAYVWLIWAKSAEPLPPYWIPPGQREALSLPDDAVRFTAHPVIKAKGNPS